MDIKRTLHELEKYCLSEDFKGWDPYDGLNSKFFQFTPLRYSFIARLAWIQLFKRNPINLRKAMLVPKGANPKGLALFLTGYCNLYKITNNKEYLSLIDSLAEQLINLKSKNFKYACWGYNFDWQSRAFYLPKFTPTVVATSFCSDALMNAYEITKNKKYLSIALSSAEFVVNDLHRTKKDGGFVFSYSANDNTCVYNASLLGSRILSRSYFYTKNEVYKDLAFQSVNAVVKCQESDGSWIYGELDIQNWIDSFHTGYNLECIYEYQKYTGDNTFDKNIKKGLEYYIKNFFLKDGTPKYYNNAIYPIDIHSPAQFIVTLYKINAFKKYKDLAELVMNWTIKNMRDNKGFFYYQIKKRFSSKIPYMRWAQSWMFYSISYYVMDQKNEL